MESMDVNLPSMKDISAAMNNFIKEYIWDPGSQASYFSAANPPKLFGMELAFPDLDIKMPTAGELLALLPEWITNPLVVVDRFIAFLTRNMPETLRKFLIDSPAEKLQKKLEEEQEALLEEAKDTKLITVGGIFSKDQINKKLLIEGVESGKLQKDMLRAILRLDDFAAKDKEYLEELLAKAKGPGSLFTHDKGLHDRLDRIFPSTESGQRAAAMMQANIQKSVDNVRQAGAQGSVNIQTNAPVTSTVTNTQGRVARAPIDTSSGL